MNFKNGDRVVFHATQTELDHTKGTVVGRVTFSDKTGDIYMIRPDHQYGDYECIAMTNACLTKEGE